MARIPDRVFVDRRTIFRGGSSGPLDVRYSVPVGSYAELINGEIMNGDTAARNVNGSYLDASGNRVFYTNWSSLNPGAQANLLNNASSAASARNSFLPIYGGHSIRLRCESVSANEDATFAALFRYAGFPPTVTEVNA